MESEDKASIWIVRDLERQLTNFDNASKNYDFDTVQKKRASIGEKL
jgi:hypothetical protein